MAFYQNVFDREFRASWVLADRQYSITFTCPPNLNKSNYQLAWNYEPYDFSTYNTLTLNYAWDINFVNYSSLSINVAGANPSQTLASEVVNILNANTTFAEMFTASLKPAASFTITPTNPAPNTVFITNKLGRIKPDIRLWITNAGAEQLLRFNKKAGVAELPTYMDRHTIANRFAYPDSLGMLIHLNETDPTVDEPIIVQAGFVPGNMQADWQLLAGRASGLFTFQNLTVDGSDRISQIIEYPAGAKVGDFARKINYTYTGGNKNPNQVTEIPYVLQSGDLVTP